MFHETLLSTGDLIRAALAKYRCFVGELTVSQAAGDRGAMAGGSGGEPATSTERVRFDPGTTGAEITAMLTPGSSARYVVRARERQDPYVRVVPRGPGIFYQVCNPDGSFLLEQMTPDREYRGSLWQSGHHVIEVINRGSNTTSYNLILSAD